MNWESKRVMVTGGSGFIGTALRRALEKRGALVSNYDIVESNDVLDYLGLVNDFDFCEPELVFHLAAVSTVTEAANDPHHAYMTNITGTINVMDVCAERGIPVIVASSDKAYGEPPDHWGYWSTAPLKPSNPYEISKACADLHAQGRILKGEDVKVTRFCNVYGPGDTTPSRLIPSVIKAYLNHDRPIMRGLPGMLREWKYIDVAVDEYIRIAEHQPKNAEERVFLQSGYPEKVGEVVEMIRSKLGGEPPVWAGDGRGEIQRQRCRVEDLSFPFLPEGIDRTIAWWREQL